LLPLIKILLLSKGEAMPDHIFLSYARKDGREHVEQLDRALAARGFQTWRDTRNIDHTQDFTAEIEIGIEQASHVLVCVTPASKEKDGFVRREIQYGLALGKPVIPLRFADIVPHVTDAAGESTQDRL
jgi:nucleoside 2-deoxyribosyltransferase